MYRYSHCLYVSFVQDHVRLNDGVQCAIRADDDLICLGLGGLYSEGMQIRCYQSFGRTHT